MNSNIGCVVVTYNRLNKLKNALSKYDMQTLMPKYVLVVNNASTDGTKEYLEKWKEIPSLYKKIVVSLNSNTGGSGGFYEGQKLALKESADWIMLNDDDAYIDSNYLEVIQDFIINNKTNDVSVICGRVMQNHSYVNGHRRFLANKFRSSWYIDVPCEYYNEENFDFDLVSYVGPVINKNKLKSAGLVEKNYFIWFDDTEHSIRLRKEGKFICINKIGVFHDIDEERNGLNWRNYYGYRNQMDLIKKHFGIRKYFVISLFIVKALLCPLKGKSFTEAKLRLTAIKDGILGNLGKNDKYKPGWKP